jgi:hypothetical protein
MDEPGFKGKIQELSKKKFNSSKINIGPKLFYS